MIGRKVLTPPVLKYLGGGSINKNGLGNPYGFSGICTEGEAGNTETKINLTTYGEGIYVLSFQTQDVTNLYINSQTGSTGQVMPDMQQSGRTVVGPAYAESRTALLKIKKVGATYSVYNASTDALLFSGITTYLYVNGYSNQASFNVTVISQ